LTPKLSTAVVLHILKVGGTQGVFLNFVGLLTIMYNVNLISFLLKHKRVKEPSSYRMKYSHASFSLFYFKKKLKVAGSPGIK
jgi:hypothetical protein